MNEIVVRIVPLIKHHTMKANAWKESHLEHIVPDPHA
jgi:hypothetical protein